jgi:hypothetical protein
MARMTTRTVWMDPAGAFSSLPQSPGDLTQPEGGSLLSEAAEPKWPAWRVTLGVIVFCGAFWTAFGYILMDLIG